MIISLNLDGSMITMKDMGIDKVCYCERQNVISCLYDTFLALLLPFTFIYTSCKYHSCCGEAGNIKLDNISIVDILIFKLGLSSANLRPKALAILQVWSSKIKWD